jgi:protein subunit release factor A
MKAILEIRAGEGGDDAKLLVPEQSRIYTAYAARTGLACEIEDDSRS